MRVLHIPARTPYARNIEGRAINIVNGTNGIPIDASFNWLSNNCRDLNVDVLHIHTLELANADEIKICLEILKNRNVGIVATLHEDKPLFDNDIHLFQERLLLLKRYGVAFATLTDGCKYSLSSIMEIDPNLIHVIPHGNVIPLTNPVWQEEGTKFKTPTFSIHGGFRPNKCFLSPIINVAFSSILKASNLRILTRSVSSTEYEISSDVRDSLRIAQRASNIFMEMEAWLSDTDIIDFVSQTHVMVLPYLWGAHSGQLELAADLGLSVVSTNVGFYQEQSNINGLTEDNLINWADWQNTNPFHHGSELLEAMQSAIQLRRDRSLPLEDRFDRRRLERNKINETYRNLYHESQKY